jgi:hypothetical protein
MRKRKIKSQPQEARPVSSLSLETLESRMLLAGNVVASVSAGTLLLVGDAYDNAVQVSTFYDSDYGWGFKVQGHEYNGSTTINGYGCDEFFGVTNLNVQLDGGDDQFALTNNLDELLCCLGYSEGDQQSGQTISGDPFHVAGWVLIQMGDGSNRVGVGPGEICGRLQIQGGRDCDEVGICETYVGGNLVIQTFGGDDRVGIYDSKTEGITRVLTANGCSEVEIEEYCTQNLVVRGGNHYDDVYIACVAIHQDLVIQTLNGRDRVEIDECCQHEYDEPQPENSQEEGCCCEYVNWIGDSVIIQTGDGDSCVGVYSVSANQIIITGGIDDDEIEVECVETNLNLRINTLDGCDDVDVADVNVFSLIITTGNGNDEVEIFSERCGNYFEEDLVVRTDGGDDCVIIGNEVVRFTVENEEGYDGKSYVGDDLIVETGDGTDYIKVFNYCIGEDMVVNAGAGDDSGFRYGEAVGELSEGGGEGECCGGGVDICEVEVGRHLTVLLGDGRDAASINDVCVEGNAVVDAGPGDDGGYGDWNVDNFNGGGAGVSIRDLFVRQNFYLYLGEGHDQASLCDVEICGNAFLYGGSDCDHIELDYVDVHNNLFVFMGGGDDKLSVDGCSADTARFYGDGGYDRFCEGSNSFGDQFVYSFEEWSV